MAAKRTAAATRSERNKRYYQAQKAKGATKPKAKSKSYNITPEIVARAGVKTRGTLPNPFAPGVIPKEVTGGAGMALDEASGIGAWAFGGLGNWFGDMPDLGAPVVAFSPAILAELAQRPEFRRVSEVIARHMVSKWIRLSAKGDEDKTDRIAKLDDALKRLKVRQAFHKMAEQDGLFGRGHLFLDFGAEGDELKTAIVDVSGNASAAKVAKGSLRRLQAVEAYWTYPGQYNSSNPLAADFYRPSTWRMQGQEIHSSRLLRFVSREMPDLLKAAYWFGGISLSQMVLPYVQNWLRTRKSVGDLLHAFSVFVLKTNLAASVEQGGDGVFRRAELFNNLRDNRGLLIVDKETEDFANVSAQLGTLDHLQAQALEQICSISGIPIMLYTGDQPTGLNASSDGAVRIFFDYIHSMQETLFRPHLHHVLSVIQLSEFGEIDPDIVFDFEPLWSLDEKEAAEVQKIKAETDQLYIDTGVLAPMESRQRVAADEDSGHNSIDVDDMPDLRAEEEEGLEPVGGRPDPELVEAGGKDDILSRMFNAAKEKA